MMQTSKFLRKFQISQAKILTQPLNVSDITVYNIIENEIKRQREGINLIPSENHCSRAVLQTLGSVMQCKYAEGYPGARYYGGTKYMDEMELLCQSRALQAYGLSNKQWGVNVQSLSGSPANFAIYTGLLQPHDRIMSLDLPHGGHLSHGYQTENKKISAVSKYFEVLPYKLNEETELIDYDKLSEMAAIYRPKILICGASAYSRLIDFERMRKIADSVKAYLLADISHTSGLMAANVIPGPFQYADVVMTTTHKSLRGPRGSLIYYRVGVKSVDQKTQNNIDYDLKQKIDQAVFPGLQGGPHFHTISAIAVALGESLTPEFKEYQKNILLNSKELANQLMKRSINNQNNFLIFEDYSLVSGGTDNHLMLVNMKSKQIDGARIEALLEFIGIYANKNTVPKDKSALVPSGLRIGSVPMTSRGLLVKEFAQIAEFIDQATGIAKKIQLKCGPKIVDYKKWLNENGSSDLDIQKIKSEITDFSKQFPLPGVDF